jgi:hypothetical protein
MEQFAVVKSGSPAKIIGPFYNHEAACQHMMAHKLIGYTVLPMMNPERTTHDAVVAFINQSLLDQPRLVDRKIELIKMVRDEFGKSMGLKEAKDAVDKILPGPLANRPATDPWTN